MIKMDQRGQISIEFVLILALMAVIVSSIGLYIGTANENSVIISAARSGADNATTSLAMLNTNMIPVRVDDISNYTSGQYTIIQVDISGSLSTNQTNTTINSILNSIAAQGYTRVNTTTPDTAPQNDYVVTNRHKYKVTLV